MVQDTEIRSDQSFVSKAKKTGFDKDGLDFRKNGPGYGNNAVQIYFLQANRIGFGKDG